MDKPLTKEDKEHFQSLESQFDTLIHVMEEEGYISEDVSKKLRAAEDALHEEMREKHKMTI